ncbi:MAG: hypothetical protein V2A73_10245 [Pseudomonadota bacterium]
MKTKADIEAYLLRTDLRFHELSDCMWVISGAGNAEQIVLKLAPPVLVCRVHVMDAPKDRREDCFKTLLELNAAEMVHGAYGLEGDKIVVSGALELENLDYNEFQATLDDVVLAVANHYPRLASFRGAAAA